MVLVLVRYDKVLLTANFLSALAFFSLTPSPLTRSFFLCEINTIRGNRYIDKRRKKMYACVLAKNGGRCLMRVFVAVGQKWKIPTERCFGEAKERGGRGVLALNVEGVFEKKNCYSEWKMMIELGRGDVR